MSVDTIAPHDLLVDVSDRLYTNPNRITEEQIAALKRAYQKHTARIALISADIEPLADAKAALPNAAFAPWPQAIDKPPLF